MKCVRETLESVHLQVECTFEYGIDCYWSGYIVKNMEMVSKAICIIQNSLKECVSIFGFLWVDWPLCVSTDNLGR
jgi:hypothetical protein